MDLIITIALVYLAYRGYQWYSAMQAQVNQGPPPPPRVDDDTVEISDQPDNDTDYIDYEELP
ncbi:hypothetical protein [Neolewinella agarilytica]|uniref:Uncharacterized protein n=1 Tax=Neolewinella agarilytica TaxID=478744 RepID=A0A1H9JJE7_9BACT|nr:hypothetical protein [Neolewinella agarilytica]SEQ86903.1 hypothetical protein SAMN05444359_11799 [Neolewinella agarilytica]